MFKLVLLSSSLSLLTSTSEHNLLHNNKNNNHNNKLYSKDIENKLLHIKQNGNQEQIHSLKTKSSHNIQTFDNLLNELNLIKEKNGKLLSPEVYSNLLKNEENDKNKLHLRSLAKKNNFIELAVFSDLECTQKTRAVGRLVNFCYNEWDSSYLFKVNRKENLIIQVQYDEVDCRGVPSKIYDLQTVTHTSSGEFSQCVNGVQWSYLPDYPTFHNAGAAYGSTYTDELICDENVKNYHGYDFRKAGFCAKVVRQNTVYSKSDVTGCEGSDEITVNYYFDSSCSGTVANSETLYQSVCSLPTWWQGDDADDFKNDSSNYVVGEVHTDYCYDPTHSSTPPPTVEGSCNIPYFNWVGDGYCDSVANNAECNYDGGDCCKQTCVSTQWECGYIVPFNCIDPDVV